MEKFFGTNNWRVRPGLLLLGILIADRKLCYRYVTDTRLFIEESRFRINPAEGLSENNKDTTYMQARLAKPEYETVHPLAAGSEVYLKLINRLENLETAKAQIQNCK